MVNILKLSSEHLQVMRQHVSDQAPLEACGLLAGKQESVEAVLKVRNADQSPVRFRMDAQEQYNAFEWIEANGLDLVGIFHSHPFGPETASPTDVAEAAYEVVHVIWSRIGRTWSARGFWIEKGIATEVDLQVITE
jgi:[CysO sulfur-carrier protein]-S-L-cysteine hydrolase